MKKQCKRCGSTETYSRGQCKPCDSARSAAYRQKNKEKLNARSAAWRVENPEQMKVLVARWASENPEKIRAAVARWQAANPEAHRIRQHNRNARKRGNGGKLSKGLAEKLFKLQKGKCACCGKPLGKDYHLDHRISIAHGGQNSDDNMQLLTQRCNQQKGAKDPIEFMRSRGFLL